MISQTLSATRGTRFTLNKYASTPLQAHSIAHSHFIARKPHSTSLSQRTVRAMASDGNIDDFVKLVEAKNAQNKVIVYSKTYCPYCTEVKSLFAQLNVAPKIIELDQLADETQVFNALKQVTKRSTVPQVFVNGQHVGGCDDTVAAYKAGRLQQMLDNAGVSYSQN